MSDFLQGMAESSRARAERTRAEAPLDTWRARALAGPTPLPLVLSEFDLIAEVKLRAPSVGVLQQDRSALDQMLVQRVSAYCAGGAAAISVLTEPSRFDGSLEHLRAAVSVATVPVMRKDFLVDPIQVYEGRAAGASGVLVIVRMVDDATLDAMCDAAAECGLFVLVEAFDEADLVRAGRLTARWTGDQPILVGVNVRDLRTLEVVPGRLQRVATALPEGVPAVAESGMTGPKDAAAAASAGYHLALVGSALMQADHPAGFAQEMIQAGRQARS